MLIKKLTKIMGNIVLLQKNKKISAVLVLGLIKKKINKNNGKHCFTTEK